MKKLSIIIVFLLTLFVYEVGSQAPCKQDSKSYFFEMEHLKSYPPYSSEMSEEVLTGYRVTDSICRNLRRLGLNEFFERQTDSDTLRYFMKYYYLMTDYDPLLLNQYCMYSESSSMPADFIIDELLNSMKFHIPFVAQLLIQSYYILHVNIQDTTIIDSVGGVLCKNLTVANCYVIDTIKGKVLPPLKLNHNNSVNFIFNFCNQWTRAEREPLNDGLGNTWLQPKTEYILFLYPRMICNDSSYYYFTIFPSSPSSLSHGMYPIINGNVQDEGNDFGLGTSVPLAKFKKHLQSLIDEIKNYGN